MRRLPMLIIAGATAILFLAACKETAAPQSATAPAPQQPPAATQPAADAAWRSLFDGKTLGKWKSTDFGGQGEVKVDKGQVILSEGSSLTGVTWQGQVPAKMNYEIELDAQRIDGNDFFCGLTFPVNDTFGSLILGGWGGSVCGISSLDDEDAARNDTMSLHSFKNGTWYHVRLRVAPDNFSAWIDNEQIVDCDTKGKKISVRSEVEPSEPLGIASYQTTAGIRNVRIRKLAPSSQ